MTTRVVQSIVSRVSPYQRVSCLMGKTNASSFRSLSSLPESIKRVGAPEYFPNEYPGMNYDFNWSLNNDGVTPLKRLAFRITKPLDLKVAGLDVFEKKTPKVTAAAKKQILEAGSKDLTFTVYDEVTQRTKDLLSLSEKLYCPEGHVPNTRTGVRVITNSASLAPQLVAYLDRAPKREPESQPITVYVLEGTDEEFSGYAIEEVVDDDDRAKSVASIVVLGKTPKVEAVIGGLELSNAALEVDEAERAAKKSNEEKQ